MKRILPLFIALLFFAAAAAEDAPAANANGNKVSITVEGETRIIKSNGLPDHTPGKFPRRGNPNTIAAQDYTFRMPANPKDAGKITPLWRGSSFGVALNGLPFDPATAEFWHNDFSSGWNYDAMSGKLDLGLDENNAHVQPNGAYHYHGLPAGLMKILGGEGAKMLMLGYAADGFPIYAAYGYTDPKDAKSPLKKMRPSFKLREGERPTANGGPGGKYDGAFTEDFEYVKDSGDLDECNGRFGVTPQFPDGIYHYFITEEFPQIGRAWRGTPDMSFRKRGPPPGRGGPGGPGGPGRPPPPPPGR